MRLGPSPVYLDKRLFTLSRKPAAQGETGRHNGSVACCERLQAFSQETRLKDGGQESAVGRYGDVV